MEFRVLGSLEVRADGQAALLGSPKERALLAILVLHAGEIVPADRLSELLWGEHPPRTAAHSIQIYVSELRKALAPIGAANVIATRSPGYLLDAGADEIDARRFERLLSDGTRAMQQGDILGGAASVEGALGLWRGPALSEFAYEDFAQHDIRRLDALRVDAMERLASAELALGREREALSWLESAIAADPLRERCRELQMLALYRSGRHAEALRVYQQFRALLVDELGLEPTPALQRLEEQILLHDPSLHPATAPGPASGRTRNPYKGLRSFGEDDAADYFGRDALVTDLLAALAGGSRLVGVVGPSGSGKSSVLHAGLVPALRAGALPGSGAWLVAAMVPGPHPLAVYEAALAGPAPEDGARVVVVIDQFEEVFSVADDADRLPFLRTLIAAVGDPSGLVTIVLALRGDFYDRPLLYPEFASVFTAGIVNVTPMTATELEAAVVRPAHRAGVEVDSALVAALVADTTDQPGGLPLLQYTLTELFDRRTGAVLSFDEYRSLGGVRGALCRRAEELYRRLPDDRREVAWQVFLRAVRLSEGAHPSRRRVPLAELTALDLDLVALSEVLDEFGRHRLLSFDRDPISGAATVEVAHEALLGAWDRLAGWIDQHQVDLRRHQALAAAAHEWEAADHNPDYLLTGTRLVDYEAWGADAPLQLTPTEKHFLATAIERRRAAEVEEAARHLRQRRLERRARTRLWALVGVAALLAGTVTFAVTDWLTGGPPDVALVLEQEATDDEAIYTGLIGAGFDRAVDEFGIDAETSAPADISGLETAVRRYSEDGVKVVVVGTPFVDVDAIAADFPDVTYVEVDCTDPPEQPNVSCMTFREEEGSFLAGAAAALKSQTGVVGFIGGVDNPQIGRFQAGYEAGARYVDPAIEVRSVYLTPGYDFSGFGAPQLGYLAAADLYADGADVIYHAAAISGYGLFRAAAEVTDRHLWAIGVDSDQYHSVVLAENWAEHVLTSMIKRVDVTTYDAVADYARGELNLGLHSVGLADGALDLSYSGGFIDNIGPQIEELRAAIIAGDIDVPDEPDEPAVIWTP